MSVFTGEDVWAGGFYELALHYGQNSNDDLNNGLRSLWSLDCLEGCYLDRDREPDEQTRLEFEPSLMEHGHLQGIASVPGGSRVACGTCVLHISDQADWIVFYCPMSALDRAYPVGGFPFDGVDHEGWRVPLDLWLADIGRQVFERTPFLRGLIGFETDDSEHFDDDSTSNIPETRYCGLLVPQGGELNYFARTEIDC